MTTRPGFRLALLTAFILAAAPAGAQLTLGEAFRIADRAAYSNRIAEGNANARSAQALAPLKGILPTLRLESGYIRTTDPIGVFGATLRQRAITQENFDPARLNYPAARGNYQSGIVLEQPIFNADAWSGRRAAQDAASAARSQQEWVRYSTKVDIVRAYYGSILADERLATLHAAARAAHAHASQAEAMVRQGMVTKSDALLAQVRAGDIDAQVAEAEAASVIARRQLDIALGGDGRRPDSTVPAALPPSDRIRAFVSPDTSDITPESRGDVEAATLGRRAASADYQRARATYLPRLNSFARLDWNSDVRPFANDRNWTVGLMVTWNPFSGASEIADVQEKAGLASVARAQLDAANANARLDVEETRSNLAVALTRLAIAERSAAQSAEAHRIVSRKYEGGLATVVELLDAQAAETQSALALSSARYSTVVSAAERLRALGRDPAALSELDATQASPNSDNNQSIR